MHRFAYNICTKTKILAKLASHDWLICSAFLSSFFIEFVDVSDSMIAAASEMSNSFLVPLLSGVQKIWD